MNHEEIGFWRQRTRLINVVLELVERLSERRPRPKLAAIWNVSYWPPCAPCATTMRNNGHIGPIGRASTSPPSDSRSQTLLFP